MSCDLYVIGYEHATFGHAIKVGIANNAGARLRSFQTGSPEELQLYFCFNFEDRQIAMEVERLFHQSELSGPIRGEWVGAPPDEVLFYLGFIIAAVLRKHYPPEMVASARRACGLLDAFDITDQVEADRQERFNERWGIVREIMP